MGDVYSQSYCSGRMGPKTRHPIFFLTRRHRERSLSLVTIHPDGMESAEGTETERTGMRLANVNALRVLRGFSWAELARRADVPPTFLQDLRRHGHAGGKTPERVYAVAAALGVSVERLHAEDVPVLVAGRHRRARPPVGSMEEREDLIVTALLGISEEAKFDRLEEVFVRTRARIVAAASAAS